MLCRAKAICCERPKELGGSRTSTADLNWPLASHVIRHHAEAVLKGGGSSSHSLSVLRGWTGHQSGDSEQMLVNHLLYTFIYIYVFFLISILVNSFILPHESYFVFFQFSSPHLTGKGGSEQMTVWCYATCQVKPQYSHRTTFSTGINVLISETFKWTENMSHIYTNYFLKKN